MQLTKTFTPDQYAQALATWDWIGVAGKRPLFASLFGDVFLEDDGIWYLDTMEGSLDRLWDSRAELEAVLATAEGEDTYLLGGFVLGAERRGIALGADQVYVFVPPPILGAGFNLDTLMPMDFVVATNIAGQLHQQINDLPEGAAISHITVDDSPPDPPG